MARSLFSPPLARLFPPGHSLDPAVVVPGELCVAQITAHLARYNALRSRSATALRRTAPTLAEAAADKIVATLRYDYGHGLEVLRKNCPPALLKKILENPALHYTAFRALGMLYDRDATFVGQKARESVDEWVLRNERQMRRLGEEAQMELLATLDDAEILWPGSVLEYDGALTTRVITRKDPPRETYPLLDERRARRIRVQPSTAKFAETFERLTGGVLSGLKWNNVFVAGGMALSTLMCVDPAMDGRFTNSDVDLYIYGLKPDQATAKIRKIYEVWAKNLGPDKKTFVVRNAKTITLMSDFPERRIQIILKMVASPAEVLLNFDLDQCAIGWNGKEVLMLPRAARALETGYTIFTSDLIYGHYLGDRRATQETRVFKYADKGFGILIPSSTMSSLEIDFSQRKCRQNAMFAHREQWVAPRDRDRASKPDVLRGKKAVRRVAWLGEDMVRRFYIGRTRASKQVALQNEYDTDEESGSEESGSEDAELSDFFGVHVAADEEGLRVPETAPWDDEQAATNNGGANVEPGRMYTRASFSDLNGRSQHVGQPNGRSGLKMFETFMRMVQLWRLEYEGRVKLTRDPFESTTYGDEGYDDLPRYEWNAEFKHDAFATKIDSYNRGIFEAAKDLVRQETHPNVAAWRLDTRHERWTGYFTRRFRRMIAASSINDVLSKQITLPLYVPPELESFIDATMDDVRHQHSLPTTDETRVLIPAHQPSASPTPNIPPIPTANVPWPLRIWIIGNTTSWAQLDRRVDEIFELLWTLFHMQSTTDHMFAHLFDPTQLPASMREVTAQLSALLERRPVPLERARGGVGGKAVGEKAVGEKAVEEKGVGEKEQEDVEEEDAEEEEERETLAFKQWLNDTPFYAGRTYTQTHVAGYQEIYGQMIPKDESWFWDEERDGGDDGGVWREPPVAKEKEKEKVEGKWEGEGEGEGKGKGKEEKEKEKEKQQEGEEVVEDRGSKRKREGTGSSAVLRGMVGE